MRQNMIIAAVLIIAVVSAAYVAFFHKASASGNMVVEQTGDAQIVELGLDRRGFTPSEITVESGRPVTLKKGSTLRGCALYAVQPEIGMNANFAKNSEYTFTPTQKGRFTYTCSMGMWKGTINIV